MFRVILLLIGLVLIVAEPNDMHKCAHLFRGGFACCNNSNITPPIRPATVAVPDDIKECFQVPSKPPSCAMQMCISKKKGYASDDGTIDKDALTKMIETDFAKEPIVIESIKANCINGDLSKYGKEDFCDLLKLQHCIDVTLIKNCSDWNDQGDCSGMKELATECTKIYD